MSQTDLLYVSDISHHNGRIDWSKFTDPVVIVKVCDGPRPDPEAGRNIIGARHRCEGRLWYCYLQDHDDPRRSAEALLRLVGGLHENEGVVVDIEEGAGDQSARALEFVRAIHDTNASTVYSGLAFWRAHLTGVTGDAGGRDWIAAYRNTEPTGRHDLWQYTDKAKVAGVPTPCDRSLYHGNVADFLAEFTHHPNHKETLNMDAAVKAEFDKIHKQLGDIAKGVVLTRGDVDKVLQDVEQLHRTHAVKAPAIDAPQLAGIEPWTLPPAEPTDEAPQAPESAQEAPQEPQDAQELAKTQHVPV